VTDGTEITDSIRDIVGSYGHLPVAVEEVGLETDLFDTGMTSHATVNVMLALEETFDIEFPEELLTRETFETIAAMASVVRQLAVAGPVSA
jgi:acyl carrier protein